MMNIGKEMSGKSVLKDITNKQGTAEQVDKRVSLKKRKIALTPSTSNLQEPKFTLPKAPRIKNCSNVADKDEIVITGDELIQDRIKKFEFFYNEQINEKNQQLTSFNNDFLNLKEKYEELNNEINILRNSIKIFKEKIFELEMEINDLIQLIANQNIKNLNYFQKNEKILKLEFKKFEYDLIKEYDNLKQKLDEEYNNLLKDYKDNKIESEIEIFKKNLQKIKLEKDKVLIYLQKQEANYEKIFEIKIKEKEELLLTLQINQNNNKNEKCLKLMKEISSLNDIKNEKKFKIEHLTKILDNYNGKINLVKDSNQKLIKNFEKLNNENLLIEDKLNKANSTLCETKKFYNEKLDKLNLDSFKNQNFLYQIQELNGKLRVYVNINKNDNNGRVINIISDEEQVGKDAVSLSHELFKFDKIYNSESPENIDMANDLCCIIKNSLLNSTAASFIVMGENYNNHNNCLFNQMLIKSVDILQNKKTNFTSSDGKILNIIKLELQSIIISNNNNKDRFNNNHPIIHDFSSLSTLNSKKLVIESLPALKEVLLLEKTLENEDTIILRRLTITTVKDKNDIHIKTCLNFTNLSSFMFQKNQLKLIITDQLSSTNNAQHTLIRTLYKHSKTLSILNLNNISDSEMCDWLRFGQELNDINSPCAKDCIE
ncbi:hypothetical protein PACTADRAFT_35265 [Pachysolen tannophilus NRRL Y-2460]|uniref:Spindle pole body-associated protein Vik1/Cik1 microtubule binding domain-containing protein n=1 Tax=Pachysolen tannophilus NRRL Y-2460 TaxID=669874 RepID=A0A1E4TRS1_PACTA|nr:hypothetical protein PACTADRAFT_35265 [Pachysolen tannophilus NRRL Y-2460]